MPTAQITTYPGVYLAETAPVTHSVISAPTSQTAFLGLFPRGPVDQAVLVKSWDEFMDQFAALNPAAPFGSDPSMAVYGVWQFFANGGVAAWIVRLDPGAAEGGAGGASASATIGTLTLTTKTNNPGAWANGLIAQVQPSKGALKTDAWPNADHVDLTLSYPTPSGSAAVSVETGAGLAATDVPTLVKAISSTHVTATAAGATANDMVTYGSAQLRGGKPAIGKDAAVAATATIGGTPAIPAIPAVPATPGNPGRPAVPEVPAVPGITLTASTPGPAGNNLLATLQPSASKAGPADLILTMPAQVVEVVPNLPTASAAAFDAAIDNGSNYVNGTTATTQSTDTDPWVVLEGGDDGEWTGPEVVAAVQKELAPGTSRLDHIAPDVFNIMCIPDLAWLAAGSAIVPLAHQFCAQRQAFLLVDPPPPADIAGNPPAALATATPATAIKPVGSGGLASLEAWAASVLGPNNIAGATYYPWVQITDPWNNDLPRWVPPSGTIAGVYATTDANRGVWKAPAGTAATLDGVSALADPSLNDELNGDLNVLGINCLRLFPIYGYIAWGARTLAGADLIESPFKYLSVRRLADYIEQSLMQSLKWAVFEPNGPPLWASITAEITPFMANLFAQGAFDGTTAAQAYSVACDATTTSADDMANGVVNIQVGFQPAEPAEFVVLHVQIGALATAAS